MMEEPDEYLENHNSYIEVTEQNHENADFVPTNETVQQLSPLEDLSSDLEILRNLLGEPDAILEPTVLKTLDDFINAGGQPEEATELLKDGFRGYPAMISLLISWLQSIGTPMEEIKSIIENKLLELILERFDPLVVDSLLKDTAVPRWLEYAIEKPFWRKALYTLSEKHPRCLVLHFAIQKASELGLHGEMAAVSTASAQFDLFANLLQQSLSSIFSQPDKLQESKLKMFGRMCCHTQYTFFFAQLVLSRLLETNPEQHTVIARLLDELDIASSHRPVVRRMSMQVRGGALFTAVSNSIVSVIEAATASPLDIIKLHRAYFEEGPSPAPPPPASSTDALLADEDTPPPSTPQHPPVALLRFPKFLSILIDELFNPQKRMNEMYKDKFIRVLALAAAVDDNEPTGPGFTSAAFEETVASLATVQAICQQTLVGREIHLMFAPALQCFRHPVIVVGVLRWLECYLTDPAYYQTGYHTHATPVFLEIVQALCNELPLIRASALTVLLAAFDLDLEGIDPLLLLQQRKTFLMALVPLVQLGFVTPVLQAVYERGQDMDLSLYRAFLCAVLTMAEPPYSSSFVSHIVALLRLRASPRSSLLHSDAQPLISAFLSTAIRLANAQAPATPPPPTAESDQGDLWASEPSVAELEELLEECTAASAENSDEEILIE